MIIAYKDPQNFNWLFRILEVLCFMEPNHVALVFFLFNFNPEMAPNSSIVWRCDLRESVLFVMIVVSSANCEILTSFSFGRRIPLQFDSKNNE